MPPKRTPSGRSTGRPAGRPAGKSTSGRPSARPSAGRGGTARPSSGRPSSTRPAGSGRPSSGRPSTGRPSTGRPSAGRSASGPSRSFGSDRPTRSASPRGDGPPSRGPRTSSFKPAGPRGASARPAGRSDGPRSSGPRSFGARSEGPRSAGPRTGGARSFAPRGDGPRSAGPRSSGPRSFSPRGDGPRSAGPRPAPRRATGSSSERPALKLKSAGEGSPTPRARKVLDLGAPKPRAAASRSDSPRPSITRSAGPRTGGARSFGDRSASPRPRVGSRPSTGSYDRPRPSSRAGSEDRSSARPTLRTGAARSAAPRGDRPERASTSRPARLATARGERIGRTTTARPTGARTRAVGRDPLELKLPSGNSKTIGDARPKRSARASEEGAPERTPRARKTPKPDQVASLTGDETTVRLNRFIAASGVTSRRKADELITSGAVAINSKVVTELGTQVRPHQDQVTVNGATISMRPRFVYLLLNKPKDTITTTSDEKDRSTVLDYINTHERVYPVGRLDRNTTGVLLVTNDGDLTNRLTHPSYGIDREYHVTLDKPLTRDDAKKIAEGGIDIGDGDITGAAEVSVAQADAKDVVLQLKEGKNREVRRIFETLGYEVEKLDRISFAGLTHRGMSRGETRNLTPSEIRQLRRLVGLDEIELSY